MRAERGRRALQLSRHRPRAIPSQRLFESLRAHFIIVELRLLRVRRFDARARKAAAPVMEADIEEGASVLLIPLQHGHPSVFSEKYLRGENELLWFIAVNLEQRLLGWGALSLSPMDDDGDRASK